MYCIYRPSCSYLKNAFTFSVSSNHWGTTVTRQVISDRPCWSDFKFLSLILDRLPACVARSSCQRLSRPATVALRQLSSTKSSFNWTICRPMLPGTSEGFWLGGQCPLAAWGEENFENLTTKWCILKYIWINMWSAQRRSLHLPALIALKI